MLDNSTPYAIVTTVYQSKNTYGAVVKNSIKAKVDLASGSIIEYLN